MIELSECGINIPDKIKKYNFYFNEKENHSLISRLERVNLSKGKFRKSLIPLAKTIERKQFKNGIYGIIFNKFVMIVGVSRQNIKILTLLKRHWRNSMSNLDVDYKIYIQNFNN